MMRVLVCTVVHHPEDARILHRQIRALLDAGHHVSYAAPFTACDVQPWPALEAIDLPRARGRSRLRALRAARRALAEHATESDIVLLHDPELLLVLPAVGTTPPVVWDVHEDTAATLAHKPWLPRPLRSLLWPAVRGSERVAERRIHLLLAEDGYRARFRQHHPVVPNTTYVPETAPPGGDGDRVVYVGHLSAGRGVADMVEMARRLAGTGVTMELIGTADGETRAAVEEAQRDGALRWHGFVPNDDALRLVDGAIAGLSLLHDLPNYRHSQPTKIIEYMAHGVPVVTTPTPPASALVTPRDCGFVVPFRDPAAAAEAVLRLRDDPCLRTKMGKAGHQAARELFHWPVQAREFVTQLERWAGQPAVPRT